MHRYLLMVCLCWALRGLAQPSAAPSLAAYRWQAGVLTAVATDSSRLLVQPWAPGVVRVRVYPPGVRPSATPSLAVVSTPITSGTQLTVTATQLVLTSAGLRVELDTSPLRVRYLRAPLDTVLVEVPGPPRTNGLTAAYFRLAPTEPLYGTGARAVPLNLHGQRLGFYNAAQYDYANNMPNLSHSIPVLLGGRGFGLFFDEVQPGYLDAGQADPTLLEYATEADHLTYFVFTQSTLPTLLGAYSDLTGHQPLPPRWALGYLQSKFGYQNEAEARDVVQRLRAAGFPLSGLVLDLYWFGDRQRMGTFDWDHTRFANPEIMLRDFNDLGVKTILITETFITQQSRNFVPLASAGLLARTPAGAPYVISNFWAGSAGLLDLTDPAARTWLWPFYKARVQEGVGGWWTDLGEPEPHPDDMRHFGGATARQVHNGFNNQWASLLQAGYARDFPTQRLFNLSRAGFAGMQRLGVIPWSGDVQRSWSGLQAQVPIMLNMGLSGVGYMHADAGGFDGGPQDNELYTRWLQFAAFTPIMRAHGYGVPTAPVDYPEPYRSIVRDYARLRQRLLPYTYTLAWENSQTGAPLARPLTYEAPTRASTSLSDSYLWGRDLLVAPVLRAAQTQRSVDLPAGSDWVDYWTGTRYAGGSVVTVAAPLARLPLLVRAGTLLPMQPYRPSAGLGVLDSLQLTYYPAGKPSTTQVYDDDGRTPNTYAQAHYQLLTFTAAPASATEYTFTAVASGAAYPGSPARRVVEYVVPVPSAALTVSLQQRPLLLSPDAASYAAADSGAYYEAAAGRLRVRFRWRHQPVEVRLSGVVLGTLQAATAPQQRLLPPYPNPFTAATTLACEVPAAGTYEVTIYDLRGRVLRRLPLVAAAPGQAATEWAGDDAYGRPLPSGVYLLALNGHYQRVALVR